MGQHEISNGDAAPDFQRSVSVSKVDDRDKRLLSLQPSSSSPQEAPPPSLKIRSQSLRGFSRHHVDGEPLLHWDPSNFQTKRDASCRKIVIPKEGEEDFFVKHLSKDDYELLRKKRGSSIVVAEQPFLSKYNRFFPTEGHFCCKACGNPLYGYDSKFKTNDGWPAFGCCVEGSIELIPATVQRQRTTAAIQLQRIWRGCLCRTQVSNMVTEMIDDLELVTGSCHGPTTSSNMNEDDGREEIKVEDPHDSDMGIPSWDAVQSKHSQMMNTFLKAQEEAKAPASSQSLGESSSSILMQFDESSRCPSGLSLASIETLGLMVDQEGVGGSGDINEIICHRCKSHLGNVVGDNGYDNDGNETTKKEYKGKGGQVFYEHHRVNGRALKYVESDLPKRTNTKATVLLKNRSQQRLLGWNKAGDGGSSSSSISTGAPKVGEKLSISPLSGVSRRGSTGSPHYASSPSTSSLYCASPRTTKKPNFVRHFNSPQSCSPAVNVRKVSSLRESPMIASRKSLNSPPFSSSPAVNVLKVSSLRESPSIASRKSLFENRNSKSPSLRMSSDHGASPVSIRTPYRGSTAAMAKSFIPPPPNTDYSSPISKKKSLPMSAVPLRQARRRAPNQQNVGNTSSD